MQRFKSKLLSVEDLDKALCAQDLEGTAYFRDPDYLSAILGVTTDGWLVYSYDLMIDYLVETDGMEYEEAAEFIDYNTIRTLPYMGLKAPIIIYSSESMGFGD